MHPELTNLLPEERLAALRREYFFRLGIVGVALVAFLILVHGALLIPAYAFLKTQVDGRTGQLRVVETALASSDAPSLEARLASLAADANALAALARVPSASMVINEALVVPHTSVTLSAFSFVPSSGKSLNTLSISGVAATRDALHRYQRALEGAAFVRNVSLPVSAYTKDTDIPFTITLTSVEP